MSNLLDIKKKWKEETERRNKLTDLRIKKYLGEQK